MNSSSSVYQASSQNVGNRNHQRATPTGQRNGTYIVPVQPKRTTTIKPPSQAGPLEQYAYACGVAQLKTREDWAYYNFARLSFAEGLAPPSQEVADKRRQVPRSTAASVVGDDESVFAFGLAETTRPAPAFACADARHIRDLKSDMTSFLSRINSAI